MEYQTETYILKVTYNLSWNTENGKKELEKLVMQGDVLNKNIPKREGIIW